MSSAFEVYVDGAAGQGKGAWAYVAMRRVIKHDHLTIDSRVDPIKTLAYEGMEIVHGQAAAVDGMTNQQAELRAAIEGTRWALEVISTIDAPVLIVSDSAYVTNCLFDRWYVRWYANGWVGGKGLPVENQDLWREFFTMLGSDIDGIYRDTDHRHGLSKLAFKHVRGHGRGTDPSHDAYRHGNEIADRTAEEALQISVRIDREAGLDVV